MLNGPKQDLSLSWTLRFADKKTNRNYIFQKQKYYFAFSCRLLQYPSAEVTQSTIDYKLHEHGKIKDDVNLQIKPRLEPRCGFQH